MDSNQIIFHITGVITVALLVFGIHLKSNHNLKKIMTTNSLIFAANMFFAGQYSGAALKIVSLLRNVISLRTEKIKTNMNLIILFIFSLYLLALTLVSDKYWYLALIGSMLVTYASLKLKGFAVRKVFFIAGIVWLIYSLLHGNMYGVIMELIMFFSFISSYVLNKGVYND